MHPTTPAVPVRPISAPQFSALPLYIFNLPKNCPLNKSSSITETKANPRQLTEDTQPSTQPYADLKSQKAFEKGLLEKTAKQTADIILYDNRIVLYKSESDVMMYVVGGVDENEIMLYNVILALRDSLHLLFK